MSSITTKITMKQQYNVSEHRSEQTIQYNTMHEHELHEIEAKT